MFREIYRWIQDITVYLIVTAAVLYAIPGKDYGKYIKFFSGLILILLLAGPILDLTGMAGTFDDIYRNSRYEMQKQEIEDVEKLYRDSGLADLIGGTEDEGEAGGSDTEHAGKASEETKDMRGRDSTGQGRDQISVGEIEIGEEE